jgi:hypothetical protein
MSNNSENNDSEFQRLKNSRFKQQKLPAWRPVPTITSTSLTFFLFGIAFIIIGIVVLNYSNQIVEVIQKYDDICKLNTYCDVTIDIPKEMTPPIMVYYQLNNFYQNHRRYVKSKSNDQLNGATPSAAELKSSGECDPIVTVKDLGIFQTIDNTKLKEDQVANPCGLIAKSLFNDNYTLSDSSGKNIFINETNIAWQADRELKYSRPKDPNGTNVNYWKSVQWTDVMDEHFMVWMRPAGLPNFRKLWGRINEKLNNTTYKLKVFNKYDVSQFNGEKIFVLSTVNSFGGKNSFLGISYIVVGSICVFMAVAFIIGYKLHNGQKKEN